MKNEIRKEDIITGALSHASQYVILDNPFAFQVFATFVSKKLGSIGIAEVAHTADEIARDLEGGSHIRPLLREEVENKAGDILADYLSVTDIVQRNDRTFSMTYRKADKDCRLAGARDGKERRIVGIILGRRSQEWLEHVELYKYVDKALLEHAQSLGLLAPKSKNMVLERLDSLPEALRLYLGGHFFHVKREDGTYFSSFGCEKGKEDVQDFLELCREATGGAVYAHGSVKDIEKWPKAHESLINALISAPEYIEIQPLKFYYHSDFPGETFTIASQEKTILRPYEKVTMAFTEDDVRLRYVEVFAGELEKAF